MSEMTRAVILKPKKEPLRFAREIVVATRLPRLNPDTYTGTFTAEADVVMDCDVVVDDTTGRKCGWHAWGPRKDMKQAYDEHRRIYHPEQTGIAFLNVPRQ
jgi:hypothetical protein